MRAKSKKGFSMIEILVAVTSILVIFAITIKAFIGYCEFKKESTVNSYEKDIYNVIYMDISYNLNINELEENSIYYINLSEELLNNIESKSIENFMSISRDLPNYVYVKIEEKSDIKSIITVKLYIGNSLCDTKTIVKREVIL